MMTVNFILMRKDGPRARIKCFFESGRQYGEFYLNVDAEREELTSELKDEGYAPILVSAFADAMGFPLPVPGEEEAPEHDAASSWEGNGEA